MQFGSYKLVDPREVKRYYQSQKHMTDIINKCNHQEFRYIDGYGKGYFLLTDNISSETVDLTIDSRTVTLSIIDKLWLEHPDKSDIGLWVYVTAEPKYKLQELVQDYNRNITIDKSLSLGSGVPTIYVMESSGTPVAMSAILANILPVGYTLSFNATDITSFDIAIDGMSIMDVFDHLCSIYGWVWTVIGTVVHVWEMDPTPSIADPINDIQASVLTPQVIDWAVSFPYYDYPGYRKGTREYYNVADTATGQGISITVCDPYYPAISKLDYAVNPDEIRNGALLITRAELITDNLDAINESLRFVQKNIYETPNLDTSTPPLSLSEVYGDWGDGPRSIYKWIEFPYCKPKIPPSKARWANNWRGQLLHTYDERIAYFVVEPIYGFDGKIPNGPQRVENIYGWNYGEIGWQMRVEWNPETGRWEGIQQYYECPPDVLPSSSSGSEYDRPDYNPPYYTPE